MAGFVPAAFFADVFLRLEVPICITANSTLPSDLLFFPSAAIRSVTVFSTLAVVAELCGAKVKSVVGVAFALDEKVLSDQFDCTNGLSLTCGFQTSAKTLAYNLPPRDRCRP